MESTSNFHKVLEKALRQAKPRKVEVHVINPCSIKNFKRIHLKTFKTDKLDAHMIALYLARIRPKPSTPAMEGQEELKELVRIRRSTVEEITRFKNRLRRLLRIHFPGYKQALGKKISRKILVAFSLFGSPHEILVLKDHQLDQTRVAFRHRIGKTFASKLKTLAREAPRQRLPQATALVIQWTARRTLDLINQLEQLDHQITLMLKEYFPDHLLHTVPGLGPVSIAAILAEVGDIKRFETVEKFIGYVGLYPIVWESGETKVKFRMTSKGNKLLKMTFLVVSAAARLFNPVMRDYYRRLREKGKTKRAAGGAIARKLAALVDTLLKNNEEWNPEKAMNAMRKAEEMRNNFSAGMKKGNNRLTEVIAPAPVVGTGPKSRSISSRKINIS